MRFFPKTEVIALRVVVLLIVLTCAIAAANSIRIAFTGDCLPAFIGLSIWIPLAAGLWRLRPIARGVTVLILWFVAIILPVGMINPFAAINDYGPNPPDVWELVAWLLPLIAGAVYSLQILGKYKQEFN